MTSIFLRYFIQAIIAETEVRIAETKKAVYEFDRDIVRGAVNQVH